MGWTSYNATHYDNRGRIDRKAECDAYFEEGLNRGHYKVVKSTMKGSVYYGAIKAVVRADKDECGNRIYVPIPEEEQEVFAVVFLTSVDSKDYFNFSYKDMDETMGPVQCDCPKSILDKLSPTDNEYALAWRQRCRERIAAKKERNSLSGLPVGTVIRYTRLDKEVVLVKHPAAYQFKRPFWYWAEAHCYVSPKAIPETFEIVKAG